VGFAKKLRDVVAANFIEIARTEAEDNASAASSQKNGSREEPPLDPTPERPETPSWVDPAGLEARTAETVAEISAAQQQQAVEMMEAAAAAEEAAEAAEDAETDVVQDVVFVTEFVNDEGDVDFEGVFRHFGVNSPKFTAEQALTMLSTMPRDLPLRVKRLTVKATLDAIGPTIGATPESISADAMAKRETLDHFLEELGDEVASHREIVEAEIASLEQQIEERRQLLKATARKRNQAEEMCRSKAEMLDQIVAFFAAAETGEATDESPDTLSAAEMDELPPFMQEDAVLRLLGITPEDADATESHGAPLSPTVPSAAGKKGGVRRRTIVRRAG
jgi:hypothetical protein